MQSDCTSFQSSRELLMSAINPSWIVGLTDGEGYFQICIHQSANSRIGLSASAKFTISLVDNDFAALEAIRNYWGFGLLYKGIYCDPARLGQSRLIVAKLSDTKQLVTFFRKHPLRTQKRYAFELWSEAVHLIDVTAGKRDGRSLHVYKHLIALRDQMNYTKGRRARGIAELIP